MAVACTKNQFKCGTKRGMRIRRMDRHSAVGFHRSNLARFAHALSGTSVKRFFPQDIIIAMKGELKIVFGGHFEDVLVALFKAYGAYDAEQIHQAITVRCCTSGLHMHQTKSLWYEIHANLCLKSNCFPVQ